LLYCEEKYDKPTHHTLNPVTNQQHLTFVSMVKKAQNNLINLSQPIRGIGKTILSV
jgi:hypothetical protein